MMVDLVNGKGRATGIRLGIKDLSTRARKVCPKGKRGNFIITCPFFLVSPAINLSWIKKCYILIRMIETLPKKRVEFKKQ